MNVNRNIYIYEYVYTDIYRDIYIYRAYIHTYIHTYRTHAGDRHAVIEAWSCAGVEAYCCAGVTFECRPHMLQLFPLLRVLVVKLLLHLLHLFTRA
jgi:hypothetical protein